MGGGGGVPQNQNRARRFKKIRMGLLVVLRCLVGGASVRIKEGGPQNLKSTGGPKFETGLGDRKFFAPGSPRFLWNSL